MTLPQVNTLFFKFLVQEFVNQEPEVYKIIFLDRTCFHRAKVLQVPENICLVCLPSFNFKLNPVKRFWCYILNNVAFHNLKDELEREQWITNSTNIYSKQLIATFSAYDYII